ncbi:Ribosomal protein L11 methyltransferase [Clostridiaceae bacterium JG1575]|nr:Ribosomal protein L11 methyltransferase [Clostridiaceae bacterium JG1575]
MTGNWNEIRLVVPLAALEASEAIFYELEVKGLSIEDPNDILMRKAGPLTWDFADINLFSEGPEFAVLRAYFADTLNLESQLQYIRERLEGIEKSGISLEGMQLSAKEVQEEDWATAWKQYYKPMRIGSRIVVKPTWEAYEEQAGDLVLEMDPGMAFGTGTHETTKMCLEVLQDIIHGNERVVDVGTGSGILAIAAKKLGAKEVLGVDLDPVAVEAARKNVALNELSDLEILEGNMLDVVCGTADLVIANIIADVILFMAKDVHQILVPGGLFLASGIIHLRQEDVVSGLKKAGFEVLSIFNENDWRAILARKSAG